LEHDKFFWRIKSITKHYEKIQFNNYNDVISHIQDKLNDPDLVYLRIKKHNKNGKNGNGNH
jgi:2,3-bisphosphoglycerate-independent phosphoglycerate mutase